MSRQEVNLLLACLFSLLSSHLLCSLSLHLSARETKKSAELIQHEDKDEQATLKGGVVEGRGGGEDFP